MVFFTCNHCGESVKKPSVDKHYNTKCRGAPKSISCMDCQKDFQDNYVEHVKCISELEKYSGKDFVLRESANSGAKKQEGWVETVRAVLDSTEYELSGVVRQAFEMLQKYDNVPRKKAKFLNFVTNSVRIPRKTVEDVWNILEKEQEKIKERKQKQLEAAKLEKESKNKEKLEQNGDIDENKKLDKKKKGSNEDELTEDKANGAETPNGTESKKKKKKQRNKQELENTDEEAEAVAEPKKKQKSTEEEEPMTNGDSLKEKKKKGEEITEAALDDAQEIEPKKKKKKTAESKALQNGVEPVDAPKTEKKNKKSKAPKDEVTVEEPQENGDTAKENKKQKNKKRAANNEESIEPDTPIKKQKKNVELTEKAAAGAEENGAYQFCWDLELANVMSKYVDGIEIEKLKKKILKKYKIKFDEELTDREMHGFQRKFTKKLYKNSQLFKVEGDIVKSVS